METVKSNQCQVYRAECYNKNIEPIMDEIKKIGTQLNNFEKRIIDIVAKMPKQILDEADTKYAIKNTEKEVISVASEIERMKTRGDNRLWEMLRFIMDLLVALGISYIAIIK